MCGYNAGTHRSPSQLAPAAGSFRHCQTCQVVGSRQSPMSIWVPAHTAGTPYMPRFVATVGSFCTGRLGKQLVNVSTGASPVSLRRWCWGLGRCRGHNPHSETVLPLMPNQARTGSNRRHGANECQVTRVVACSHKRWHWVYYQKASHVCPCPKSEPKQVLAQAARTAQNGATEIYVEGIGVGVAIHVGSPNLPETMFTEQKSIWLSCCIV